ncbi:hypothetical protein H6G89_18840 [Oscillatoria sp. FACHB-1407]|uniref:N-acyl amino acid synthase FeeM domain-containing protein n=1 Tax=Oscillatoria sp. FACHB-1407 TaxID=2692847 RepID=UPI0016863D09|nr:hypothetical protein [Oscillatoria sp. FACHB-1407]MBD2463096.1 hypothetical protein [Oscillatoria sp. FACHB-1407]
MKKQWMAFPQSSHAQKLREKIKIKFDISGDLIFKIAETKSELEQAFQLVHDAYAQEGYIEPHPSGIRVCLMDALPTATTFVGMQGDKVVATTSLFPDSALGLPLDTIYKSEADHIRHQYRRIAEVGKLASNPDFRFRDSSIPLHLNKIMFLYATEYLRVDDLVITVNPKHQRFYIDILLFEQIGEVKSLKSVNDNPAVLLRLDLRTAKEQYRSVYQDLPLQNNLYYFYTMHQHDCIHLPAKRSPVNVWSEELLHYFFQQKTDLFRGTTRDTLNLIKALHLSYYSDRLEQIFRSA